MIKMSDILKKKKEDKEKDQKSSLDTEGKEKTHTEKRGEFSKINPALSQDKKYGAAKTQQDEGVKMSSLFDRKADTDIKKIEDAENLYKELLSFARDIFNEKSDHSSINIKKIMAEIEKIIEQMSHGNEHILILALTKNSEREDYLLCHLVNSCVLSVKVGLAIGYDKKKLTELGMAGFLHDIGMVKYKGFATKPRKLASKEYEEIKKHSIHGAEILHKIEDLDKIIAQAAHQHHERIDSSGYPDGLKGEYISEYARIIGVVDVYEAMVHPRSYREALLSLDAIKEILADKKAFEYRLIKVLIEDIGIFPVGSFVELNTKEIAEVVKPNRNMPMRPVAKIVYSAGKKKVEKEHIIDLAARPAVWIERQVKKNELEKE